MPHSSETGPPSPDPDGAATFDAFDLSDEVLDGVAAAGYLVPTPVQVAAIPHVLEGRRVVVQAKTGTGKTAAFGLPLLELLDGDRPVVQALVLTPTRELARQVAAEIERLGRFTAIKGVAIYGGDSMSRQVDALRGGAQIVVGTPGRVLDHLRRRTLDARRVRWLVLDEADEMLSMGFAKELNAILSHLPERRRTLLFSATFPKEVEGLVARHVPDPVRISLSSDTIVAEAIEHHYYLTGSREKDQHLVAVLDEEAVDLAIVFCNRRDETRMVANVLRRHGFNAQPINSDLAQSERDDVMRRIRLGEVRVLVGTDIAARGIDITGVSHVVNYSVPDSPEQYVHRAGRTGRIGRRGTAVSLVSGRELSALKQVERIKGIVIEERRLPAEEVIMERRVERLLADLKHVASVRSPEQRARGDRPEFSQVAERIQADPEGKDVIYLLLQTFFEGIKKTTATAARGTEIEAAAGEGDDGSPPPRRAPRRRVRGR